MTVPARRRRAARLSGALLLLVAAVLGGCEERHVQDRAYKSEPEELRRALARAKNRAECLEVLDLLAATDVDTVRSHPQVLDTVRPLLSDADPVIAAKSGDVLAQWGDAAVLIPLATLLEGKDPWVRLSAVTSLALLGHPDAIAPIAEATTDPEANVRAQACRALADLRLPLSGRPLELVRGALADPHASVRAAAAAALGWVGGPGERPLLRAALRDSNDGVVVAAAHSLGRLRDGEAIPLLLEILASGNQATRVAAAAALGRIGDDAVVPALIAQLERSDSVVRREVMRSLSRLADRRGMLPVLALAEDDDPLLQTYVPFVAARLYQSEHFELFRTNLAADAVDVRAAAALALGLAEEMRSVPLLRRALQDPHPRVRIAALRALGLLGAAEAVDEIEHTWHYDPNPQVRDAAEVSLALVRIDAPNRTQRLLLALEHEVMEVRFESTGLIAKLELHEALEALRSRLRDEQHTIQHAARHAIKQLQDD